MDQNNTQENTQIKGEFEYVVQWGPKRTDDEVSKAQEFITKFIEAIEGSEKDIPACIESITIKRS